MRTITILFLGALVGLARFAAAVPELRSINDKMLAGNFRDLGSLWQSVVFIEAPGPQESQKIRQTGFFIGPDIVVTSAPPDQAEEAQLECSKTQLWIAALNPRKDHGGRGQYHCHSILMKDPAAGLLVMQVRQADGRPAKHKTILPLGHSPISERAELALIGFGIDYRAFAVRGCSARWTINAGRTQQLETNSALRIAGRWMQARCLFLPGFNGAPILEHRDGQWKLAGWVVGASSFEHGSDDIKDQMLIADLHSAQKRHGTSLVGQTREEAPAPNLENFAQRAGADAAVDDALAVVEVFTDRNTRRLQGGFFAGENIVVTGIPLGANDSALPCDQTFVSDARHRAVHFKCQRRLLFLPERGVAAFTVAAERPGSGRQVFPLAIGQGEIPNELAFVGYNTEEQKYVAGCAVHSSIKLPRRSSLTGATNGIATATVTWDGTWLRSDCRLPTTFLGAPGLAYRNNRWEVFAVGSNLVVNGDQQMFPFLSDVKAILENNQ